MGTIMALRNDILKPGGYASVPHCILESSKLEPSDKLVYQALLDRLGQNDFVWPSQATIARQTALSIRSVRRSVARLTEIGLISCEVVTGTSNHYTFTDPEVVLNMQAEADSVSDLSQRGGGHDDRTNPVTLTVPPATMTGVYGHDDRGSTDTVADEPLHLTTSVEPRQGTTSGESPHSPQPPAAAGIAEPALTLEQVKPSHRILLEAWAQQGRPLPPPAKIKTFLKLLAIQEQQAGYDLDPALVLETAEPSDQLLWLVKRQNGCYLWQLLQRRPDTTSSKHIKRVLDKRGETAARIEEVYQAYPRRVGKAAALKAIKAAIKRMEKRDSGEDAIAFLLERTKLFAASLAGQLGRFTPHPATWFNRESYLDDEQEWDATENRSGSLKRDLSIEEDTTPGMSLDDL